MNFATLCHNGSRNTLPASRNTVANIHSFRCKNSRKTLGDSQSTWKILAQDLNISVSNYWKEEIRADTITKMVSKLRPLFDAARTGTMLNDEQYRSVMRRIHLINNEMTLKSKVRISSNSILFDTKHANAQDMEHIINLKLSTSESSLTFKIHVPNNRNYKMEITPITGTVSKNTNITFKMRPLSQTRTSQIFDISIYKKQRLFWEFRTVTEYIGVFTVGMVVDSFQDPNSSLLYDSSLLPLIRGPTGADETLKALSTVNIGGKILIVFPALLDVVSSPEIKFLKKFSDRIPIVGITSPDTNFLIDSNVLSYQRLDKVLQNTQGLEIPIKLKFALDVTLIIREFETAKIPLCLHPKNFSVVSLDPNADINVIIYNPQLHDARGVPFGAWTYAEKVRELYMSPRGRLLTFGLLLWTIFTQEEFPKTHLTYPVLSLKELPSVEEIEPEIATLMRKCWNFKEDLSLDEVMDHLQKLLQ